MKRIFYTDGACSGNPGKGGYSIIWYDKNNIIWSYAADCENTTNNREELKAILHAIEIAKRNPYDEIIVYSDSSYAVNSIKEWIYNWAKNGWKNSKKETVENLDLMQEIYSYVEFPLPNLTINKIKGHGGNSNIEHNIGNELADALATGNKAKYLNLIKKYNIIDF